MADQENSGRANGDTNDMNTARGEGPRDGFDAGYEHISSKFEQVFGEGSAFGRNFDFSVLKDRAQDFLENFRDVPGYSRDFARKVDSHARANPWLHIGVVGAASLAIGVLIGRSASRGSSGSSVSTRMGARYEDLDDALDD